MRNDDKVFEKYLKVAALAEQGSDGEGDNARRIMQKMEREHPWLPEARKVHLSPPEEEFRPAHEPEEYPSGASWADIFSAAQSMYNRVSDFAETVAQSRHGSILAAACKVSGKISRSGNLVVGVSVPEHILEELEECNLTQLRVFRNQLMERLEAELNEALGLDH